MTRSLSLLVSGLPPDDRDDRYPSSSNANHTAFPTDTRSPQSQQHQQDVSASSDSLARVIAPSSTPAMQPLPQNTLSRTPSNSEWSDYAPPTSIVSLAHGYSLDNRPTAEAMALRYGYTLPEHTSDQLSSSPSIEFGSQSSPRADRLTPAASDIIFTPSGSSSSERRSAIATPGHSRSGSAARSFATSGIAGSERDITAVEDQFGIFSGISPVGALELDSRFADALGIDAGDGARQRLDLLDHDMTIGHADTSNLLDSSFMYLSGDDIVSSVNSNSSLEMARPSLRKRSLEGEGLGSDSDSSQSLTWSAPLKRRRRHRAHFVSHAALNCPDPTRCIHLDQSYWSDNNLMRRGLAPLSRPVTSNDAAYIPDFVGNFFPDEIHRSAREPFMQIVIDDCIESWVPGRPINVSLTMHSFHCALQLQLHEYVPTSHVFNGSNTVYRLDKFSGKSVRCKQYTPPLGLKAQGAEIRMSIDGWLDQLLRPKFGFMMFQEFVESHASVPNGVLDSLYKLYLDTQDRPLRDMLSIAMRIYPLSYAKTHIFTMLSGEMDGILDQMQDPRKPSGDEAAHMPYISPKMANRQAKVVITTLLVESIQWHLNMVQDALDETSNIQPTTVLWFRTFCLVLNLAIVIEKLGGLCHTAWYHRPVSTEGDVKFPEEHARLHCEQDYQRMDQTFERLVDLFFKRFRAGVWSKTDFEMPGTGKLRDPASKRLLLRLINLIMTYRSVLAATMDTELDWEDMFLYRQRYLWLLFIPIGKSIDAAH